MDFSTTYFFALKVRDEWGNASDVSNSPFGTTLGIPDIEVSPDSLVDSLLTGDTSTHILTIKNIGEDPSTLDFFFPQYGGEASLRVTSVEGNRLSFQVVEDSFVSVEPTEGTVPAGDSVNIAVTLDATGMFGGDYEVDIEIYSNDPDESLVIVPAHLHVTGAPDIAVSPDSIDYGLVFIGASVTDTVVVSNVGTDLLTVSDISSDNPDYAVDPTSFGLNPGESQEVLVTFTPSTTGAITGTLTITSDDPTDSIVTVFLEGEGALPPDISITPDSLSDTLLSGDTSTHILTISNTGLGDLTFDISIQGVDSAASMSVEEALAAIVQRSGILEHEIRVNSIEEESGESRERVCTNPEEIASVRYASGAAPSAARLSVAIAAAAGGASNPPADVRDKLLGTGRFNSVAIIDVSLATPTVAELQAFDGVIVWNSALYLDPVTFGDNLADYVDGGGGVVAALFEVAGGAAGRLGGRWESEEYYVIARSSFQTGQATLGTIEVSGHPTVAGVSSFDGGSSSYRPTTSVLTAGSTLIAKWSDGKPLVAVKKIGVVDRVDLGFYPPSSDVSPGWWQVGTDGDLLLANALEWVTGPLWLYATPSSGTVAPDSSMDIEVTFDATGLKGGDYEANIVISSNDPDELIVTVPAFLHVNICGDVDGDAQGPNIVDVAYLVDYLFDDGPPPPVMEAANVDGINSVNVGDLTYLVEYLFHGGPALVCAPIE